MFTDWSRPKFMGEQVTAALFTGHELRGRGPSPGVLELPVLWTQTIRALAAAGVTRFAEADPGHVLGDLTYEILSVPVPAARTDRFVAA